MPPHLQSRFDAIERQRALLQGGALASNEAQLNWTPKAGVWSIGQIIHHLVLSDETIGRAQEAGQIMTEEPMFRVLPRAWRRALVLTAFNRDAVLPLPSPAVKPRGDVPLSRLLERWQAAREGMRGVLDTLHGDERRYAHPVLGPLTAAQMLELGQTHTAYHTRQIEALRRDPSFPPIV